MTDDLQVAVNAALPGDRLILPDGFLWSNLVLPAKPSLLQNGEPLWVDIVASTTLTGGHVMPRGGTKIKIISTGPLPALSNDYSNPDPSKRTANHYRLDGIAISVQRARATRNRSALVVVGGQDATLDTLPHDLEFRHMDIQGDNQLEDPGNERSFTTKEIARGLSLEGLNIRFVDCSIQSWTSKTMVIGDSEAGGFKPDQPFPQMPSNWFSQALVASRSRIRYLGNAGLLANTTAANLQRLHKDVISKGPDKVFVLTGYTDVGNLTDVDSIMADIASMVKELKAAGIQAFLCNLPGIAPIANNGFATPLVTQELNYLNFRIAELAGEEHVPLVDMFSVTADPITSQYRPGYSADGFHPQMPATRLMAEAAIKATEGFYEDITPWIPSSDPDGINLIQDPLFKHLSSKWTLSLEAGFVPAVVTVSQDAGVTGQTITLSNIEPASASVLVGAPITDGFRSGDRLAFAGRIKSSNCESGMMQFSVGLNFANVSVDANHRNNTHPIMRWPVDIIDGQFYMEFVVPTLEDQAVPASISPVIEVNSGITRCQGCASPSGGAIVGGSGAIGGTGSLTVGQIGLVNLTRLGL